MDSRLKIFMGLLGLDLVFGIVGFMLAEGLRFTDALYLSVVTVATVGYGDITPHTAVGRMIAVAFIIIGVGSFTGVIAHITESLVIAKEEDFRRDKLKMIVSEVYAEIGTRLIGIMSKADPSIAELRPLLAVDSAWDHARFVSAARQIAKREFSLDHAGLDLPELRILMITKAELFLRILESPSLSNDAPLADLVRALLHLKDELTYRDDFDTLPKSDLEHLGGDAARAYRMLTLLWLEYMEYVKEHYAYLFSLAVRVNPYKENASAIVGGK